MTEKELTKLLQKTLKQTGWLGAHFHDSRREIKPNVFIGDLSAKGFPDIVAIKKNRLLVVELKSETGKLREQQPEWLDAFSDVGAEVFLWRPTHWKNGAITQVLLSDKTLQIEHDQNEKFGVWEKSK